MSYRDTTYVIFDGDNDIWAYGFMRGWDKSEHVDFSFADAHDLKPLTDRAEDEAYIESRLRERFASATQVIVLIGKNTKNLYRFVRWEMEVAQKLDLPIIAVNLNDRRIYDSDLCPPILRDRYVVHVPFKAKIIRHALDHFPGEYRRRGASDGGNRNYPHSVFTSVGL
jgi:hypothetical protein